MDGRAGRAAKPRRQQLMRDLASRLQVASQLDFVALLAEHGFKVTQATVSRDIAELRLVKIVRGDRHVYATPADLAGLRAGEDDDRLRRVLADLPVTVRRSGLILLLVSSPGSASAIAEAIDRSRLTDQEGTLAGDNTVLVLFRDEERLERWRARLAELQAGAAASLGRPRLEA